MFRLMLLRHAKALPFAGGGDHDRVLAERGRDDAARMGAYLAQEHLLPDFAVVSDARRTLETWEIVGAALPTVPLRHESRIYEASMDRLLDLLRQSPDEMRAMIAVGHNPGFQELAMTLTGFGDRYAAARMRAAYPTCGLAVLDLQIESWSQAAAGCARLDRFVTPKSLGGVDD
jgi:phosphohistidine phosphatase